MGKIEHLKDVSAELKELQEKNSVTSQMNLPKGYLLESDWLYKVIASRKDDETNKKVLVTSTHPIIESEYVDIENGDYSYNLTFRKNGKKIKLTLDSEDLSQKKHIINLAKKGFDVYDSNAIDIINYIHSYKRMNEIPTIDVATRLGHIKDKFVSPYKNDNNNDVQLITLDPGYKSLLKGFEKKGKLSEYSQEVFQVIKDLPVVMTMLYGALGSILIKEFNLEPFIIDNSGRTSSGKSFTLKVASSVWGNDKLITEWNSTRNSIETQATFLNSFVLIKDDTRKAGKDMVVNSVYNFSGGKSKNRSNTKRTLDEIKTWNNIMLSTGETSIPDIAGDKAGVSGRVITLQQSPYPKDFDFTSLADAIDKNHGVLGSAFMEHYQKNRDKFFNDFKQSEIYFIEKANGNEVMTRLSRPFALLRTVGEILCEVAGFEHDPYIVVETVYKDMVKDNMTIDKPIQMLEELLTKLVSQDSTVYKVTNYHLPDKPYNYEKIIAYQYSDYLVIDKGFVDNFLGMEKHSITKQWKDREMLLTETNRMVKKTKSFKGRVPMYCIKNEVISDCGFDFGFKDCTDL